MGCHARSEVADTPVYQAQFLEGEEVKRLAGSSEDDDGSWDFRFHAS